MDFTDKLDPQLSVTFSDNLQNRAAGYANQGRVDVDSVFLQQPRKIYAAGSVGGYGD